MATKRIPKIKQQKRKDFKDLLKQNSDLKTLMEAPKTFKKVLVKPIKDTKEFGKNFKQGVKDQVINEVPILGLLFGNNKKDNKKKTTKRNPTTTLNKILKEIRLISASIKSRGKESKEYSSKQEADTEKPEENKQPIQEGKSSVSGGMAAGLAAVVGTIGVGVMSLFSKKAQQPAEQIPQNRVPAPALETGNTEQDQQTSQLVVNTDPNTLIDGIESKYKNLPTKAEKAAKDVEEKKDAAKNKEEEEKRRKEQADKEREKQARARAPSTPSTPTIETRPATTATQPQPKPVEIPGAVKTGTGGALVDVEGKAITAPATVEQKPTPAPMPAPTPAPAPRPTPAPRPAPAPAALPTPTPAPSAPVAEQRPKPTSIPAPVPPPPAVREQQKPIAPSGKPAKPGFEAGKAAMIQAMNEYGITDPMARAQMVAQAAHESGKFVFTVEQGKDEYFKRYEGRKDLGNTQEGDGIKFKGRGFLQTTGRVNYEAFKKAFGIDVVSDPGLLAADATVAAKSALFWFKQNARKVANLTKGDWTDTRGVTKAVNGGFNGLEERIHYFEMFKNDKSITGISEEVAAKITDNNIVKNTLLVRQKENINIKKAQ